MSNIKWHEVTWYSWWGAIVLFLVVVPILAFVIGTKYQEVKYLQQSATEDPGVTGSIKEDFGNISFSFITSTSTSSNIDFKMVAPKLTFSKDKNVEDKINDALDQEMKNLRIVYEDSVSQLPCNNAKNPTKKDCKSAVDIVATSSISKKFNSVSVEFDVFISSESMAHPSFERDRTVHFDLKTGDEKNYLDILGGDRINLLNKLSLISREKLSNLLKINQNSGVSDTFEKGTSPLEENYKNILLGDDGLMVNFREYQIGTRPYGAPQIFISYQEL